MTDTPELRLAMWSGPRNISTAMMRSWGNRPDTFVCDEPLYAHYLKTTGADHPGAAEVIAHQEPDWRRVADWLTGPIPEGRSIFYQKHMSHHLLPSIERGWLDRLTHVFLLRDPADMLTSLLRILPEPDVQATGLPQQWELFQRVADRLGAAPPVLDARDVQNHPRDLLTQLCSRLGVPFLEEMLSWPPGPRETDGIWARHWYSAVTDSTGFKPYQAKPDVVPDRFLPLLEECQRIHERLFPYRLQPTTTAD